MVQRKSETALGVARARFIAGLRAQNGETKRLVNHYVRAPADARARDALRGHLHTLYASAQVFQIDAVAIAVRSQLERLDRTPHSSRDPETDAALLALCATLPQLAEKIAPAPKRMSSFSVPSMLATEAAKPQPVTRPIAIPSGTSVASVLVVADAETQGTIRAALPSDRYEIVVAHDRKSALQSILRASPDIVFLDRGLGLKPADGFVRELRSIKGVRTPTLVGVYAATEVPTATEIQAFGLDDALPRPLRADAVLRTVRQVLEGRKDTNPFGSLGKLTLDQLVSRLAEEMRRGLVDSALKGRWESVSFGEGSEVLASVWSAIARVRSAIVEKSQGQIAFRDTTGPDVVAIASTPQASEPDSSAENEISLKGIKALVADDDPAVVWFFAGLLREAGVEVVEAEDGLKALYEARRFVPDVILADILMPQMDGLALCKAVQRDPALAEVPVILLSWKEDFLQRMRELKAGASGYLRKEARAEQILSRVREVLAPQIRLAEQLKEPGELRGHTDGLGVLKLLRIVSETRPNASITIRDAWNVVEVELRDSTLAEVMRTSVAGGYERDDQALAQLVGVTSGRYTVVESRAPIKDKDVRKDLQQRLEHFLSMLGATIDALSGSELMRVDAIAFNADAVDVFAKNSPARVQQLVRRLASGVAPRDMVISSEVDVQTLESILVDLARRGAIHSVMGDARDDRVAIALERRHRPNASGESPLERGALRWHAQESAARPPTAPFPLSKPSAPISTPKSTNPDEEGVELGAKFDALVGHDEDLDGVLREVARQEGTGAMREQPSNPWPADSLQANDRRLVEVTGSSEAKGHANAVSDAERRPGVVGWLFMAALIATVLYFASQQHRWDASLQEEAVELDSPNAELEIVTRALPSFIEPFSGKLRNSIQFDGVEVSDGQGLLVIEGGPADEVAIDGKLVLLKSGVWALDEGQHELELLSEGRKSRCFFHIHPGKTRVVQLP